MIGLLILVLVVAVLVWLAATYVPHPFGWILAAIILILAVVELFGGSTSCC